MSGTIVANTDPTAIESGNSWNGLDTAGAPVIVTFSFPTSLAAYDATIAGFTPATVASFTAFTAAEQTQALAALGQWAAASGIVFLEVPPGQGDITFANIDFSTTTTTPQNGNFTTAAGIGFYPFGDWSYSTGNSSTGYGFTSDLSAAGAVFMNSDFISNGTVDLGTLLHEIGHAIGMKHPDQVVYTADGTKHGNILANSDTFANTATLTIMSEAGDTANDANPSLFALDKSAAADLYGPAGTGGVETTSAAGSNSVSTWDWDAATNTLIQTAVSANETIHGSSVNDVIYGYDFGGGVPTSGTISLFGLDGTNMLFAGSGTTALYGGPGTNTLVGGAGTDSFYVYSNQTTVTDAYTTGNTTTDENTLYATGVNATLPENVDTLYLYGAGLTGTGNDQDDVIYGDGVYGDTLVAGTGNDYMGGGSGGNTLVAGPGIDTMYGGAGSNRFVFAPGDAPATNPYYVDYIGDFKPAADAPPIDNPPTDKLDFSAYAAAGHPLSFIGTASLTAPGQVDFYTSDGDTFVEGDVTSPGGADFEIELYGNLNLQASDFIFTSAPCYLAGTRILTPDGEIPVEQLSIGDRVIIRDGRAEPIKWIGRRAYQPPFTADPTAIRPIRFAAGCLADGIPKRDLFVSPEHAMLIDGLLIPAALLLNGRTITQPEPAADIQYVHIELAAHDAILAEGAWSETFVDDDSRLLFNNAADFRRRYPDAPVLPALFCAPRVTGGYQLQAIRQRLGERAGTLRPPRGMPLKGHIDRLAPNLIEGWAQNPDHPEAPVCVDILVDDVLIARTLANRYRADLERAGLGSGHHAFQVRLPDALSDRQRRAITIRRSLDGARLAA